jgi:uncharacterized short protein YbdD (DUF466 family)
MVGASRFYHEQKLKPSIGLFEYEEYISLKTINDPNEGCVTYPCAVPYPLTCRLDMRPFQIL